MKAAIFKILIPGPIKTYDKPLLTFLKHLLAILLLQASFDVYELTERDIRVLFIIIIIIIVIVVGVVIVVIIIIIIVVIIIKCNI